jgi:hypothetical protein
VIGAGVATTAGAIKYASNTFYGYNGTDWVVLATGGSGDTNCDADGECTLILYWTNATTWDKNEADDIYLNGSRPLTSNWYAGKQINATTFNSTTDKWCNLTNCYTLAQLIADTDTNCDANGECTNVAYHTNLTNYDKNEADDVYLNGTRQLTAGWYTGKPINATALNSTLDKFCNLTHCFTLAQFTADTDTQLGNSSTQMQLQAMVAVNSTDINSNKNITTSDSIMVDADSKAAWFGADQDAAIYFNGTCLISMVKGGDEIHLC